MLAKGLNGGVGRGAAGVGGEIGDDLLRGGGLHGTRVRRGRWRATRGDHECENTERDDQDGALTEHSLSFIE